MADRKEVDFSVSMLQNTFFLSPLLADHLSCDALGSGAGRELSHGFDPLVLVMDRTRDTLDQKAEFLSSGLSKRAKMLTWKSSLLHPNLIWNILQCLMFG